ncbi:3-oxoacyl-ACP synthase III family protein [Sphingomonas sp. 8AM]|uniref:3-oxoacyl-ACP synthase III family protein n=1 Tax=Sphingomonas sp. 8AM TaxID=2653170 RepID=UPI0012F3B9E2|nr:ketoacyl-ACP synthase III [Sphingomonas sp. 8AM]VXD01047.1 Beta-ketoacyl-acyl-carrier-protein synthase I [Sphingomonas sp. 8AM]
MNRIARSPLATGATIAGIATHLPDGVLGNEALAEIFPEWPAAKIMEKIGIRERRVAAPGETAADLAFAAATKLFAKEGCDPESIDFLIFCSQAPDYILPTTACVLQHRLGLSTRSGAVDLNLGCSGFVYGLSLATGLIASGAARRVLLLTADTYSKYIHDLDKSVRTLFGDGAAATLVVASEHGGTIGPFVFGTDGRGADSLMVPAGGFRTPHSEATAVEHTDRAGNVRSANHLYMDGAAVMAFTLREVPRAMHQLLEKSGAVIDDYEFFVLHQANKFMLDALQKKLGIADDRFPRRFEDIGNTVSSTIPFVLAGLMADGQLKAGTTIMVIGFGVGLSWAAGAITL